MPFPKSDGRITYQSHDTHLESIHPSLVIPVSNSSFDSALSSGNVSVSFGDSASLDAFARLRVSNPTGIFDSQLQYDLHRILWEDSGTGAVTHDPDSSSADLAVASNESIIRQTRQYFRYQPGKSQMILMTFVMNAATTGLIQRVGYFDDDNGLFLELSDSTISMVTRTSSSGSPVDNAVAQASWNHDTFDGTGVSGITLDLTKSQILFIDLEWLAVGRVRMGFVIDGIPRFAHEFMNANVLDTVYMTTANLPLRYEIDSDAGVSGTLKAICGQISSEGGVEVSRGIPFSASNGATLRTAGTSTYLPLLSFRPKLTFNGIANRGVIMPETLAVFSSDRDLHYRLIFGGTLTGASFSSVNADSIAEYDISATAISGGIDIMSNYVATGAGNQTGGDQLASVSSLLPIALNIAGAHPTSPYTDIMTIAAISAAAQAASCGASMSWRELR